MSSSEVNKRIGGMARAEKARQELEKVFVDDKNPLYFSKDIEFARAFGVSRHTIYSIREDMKISPRTDRILKKLKSISIKKYTLKELSEMLHVKYHNLYKIMDGTNLKCKPDVAPVESLIKYQKNKKKERKALKG